MNQDPDNGLSDALRDMANGDHSQGPQLQPEFQSPLVAQQPVRAQPQRASTHPSAQHSSNPVSKNSPTRQPVRKTGTTRHRTPSRPNNHGLKATAAPLLATVGALLLVPGIWAVLILNGTNVFGADREDAKHMAMAMLVCWPIALSLIATAVIFFRQMLRDGK